VILGIAFIVSGILLFMNPLDGDLLEKIYILTFLFFGAVFLIYSCFLNDLCVNRIKIMARTVDF
jgi:hypothetical protein